ncbi:MAG: phosphoribosylformylglycinamidine synthase subunit PurL [Armatimonadetes bacterium]|nr:phosphoribosylformylglycinamidine synthase subunit PurL [Armatimonadota bacterium]MBX3109864.1 phosphoribosylformylglycinamidine synthase subunit PurL [Fimbriimonadaceae bacterium]
MAAMAPDVYRSMGLRDSEFERIVGLMGREPSLTETGMFAVMWSEHCGYKYSRPILRYFAEYKKAMDGAGLENAGIVEIGDGLGIAMKVESHNHPSAVEPYQGAATGVGGIIRDIFTMGARPIACLNSLRFGPLEGDGEAAKRNRYLFDGVVRGIAGYGNCVGVPTVGGEVSFHPRFNGRPLVNAMCIGIVECDKVATAGAEGVGNPVIYLGSATGKDGIHGATFASEELGEDNHAKRPNVQIGDPFAEKQLIEATLEALQTGAVQSIQDMGAAGLTCSTIEMSAKGGVGMEIDLDLVPMRESDMSGYELMLSESQERMLAVAHHGREQEVIRVFEKWGVHARVIGHVTGTGRVVVRRHGEIVADVEAVHLADMCPTYTIEGIEPDHCRTAKAFDISQIPIPGDLGATLVELAGWPDLADKSWVFGQYDFQVQTQTALCPGDGDAAVLAPRGTAKGLAVKIDGNGHWVRQSPYAGGQLAVCEAARNVACVGGVPAAATDGLNYGSPEDPGIYWTFDQSVKGIADACEALGTPVVSGNVSFYNHGDLGEVLPTPMIGMLGILPDASKRCGSKVHGPGGTLCLLSYTHPEVPQQGLGASAYLRAVHGIEDGIPVPPVPALEKVLCHTLAGWINQGLVEAAHDVSEGGLGFCVAEMVAIPGFGAEIELPNPYGFTRCDALLYAELPGFVVIAVKPENIGHLRAALPSDLNLAELGPITDGVLRFRYNGDVVAETGAKQFAIRHASCLDGLVQR